MIFSAFIYIYMYSTTCSHSHLSPVAAPPRSVARTRGRAVPPLAAWAAPAGATPHPPGPAGCCRPPRRCCRRSPGTVPCSSRRNLKRLEVPWIVSHGSYCKWLVNHMVNPWSMDSKWQWEGDEVFSFNSICHGKNHGFLKMFPLNQAIDRIVQMFRVVQYDLATVFFCQLV